MDTSSTQNIIFLFVLILFFGLLPAPWQNVQAQCSASTPVFDVNLIGKPNGIWTSPSVNRDGLCCKADKNDNCVQFNILLDRNSGGLQFDISSGPVPSGSMFYQVDCGASVPVGSPICLTGPGPHKLTLCMPGNASNTFSVKSIAAFVPVPDVSVTAGCFTSLQAPFAFFESSVSWRDITGGGAYNKYLSCLSGCSSPTVTPDNNPPPFVDYVVCGNSQTSLCATLPYCDTVRVYFYPPPVVSISPEPAIICPGANGVELIGNVTGGDGKFSYIWTDSQGGVVATTRNYTATSVGAYRLEVRNESYPKCKKFEASVTVVNDLSVETGPDQMVCAQSQVQLAGAVTGATGAIWSGGAGAFSPDNRTINALYTPTEAELAAGKLTLTLTSTGNGNCAPVQDEVLLSFYTVNLTLTGTAVICGGATGTISASVSGAVGPIQYLWNTGETEPSLVNKPAGTYTVVVRDSKSCSVSKSFTITQKPGPSDFVTNNTSSTCGAANGQLSVGAVTGGTAPYTYSRDGTSFQASSVFAGLAAGSYTITVKDATGCTLAKAYTVQNIAGPSAVAASAEPASCADNDGRLTAGAVTGGTSPYTYSINGTSSQTETVFSGLASGAYTLRVRDANGCLVSTSLAVGKVQPTGFASTTTPSTCGQGNGQLTVTAVTGGTAPFTYSKDGTTFQSSATFASIAAGPYTITVKDSRGCTFARQVEVGNISGPSGLTTSVKATTCGESNGEITVQAVSGGTAPYTYSLGGDTYQTSNSFSSLAAGNYELFVKDVNGCLYSKEVQVQQSSGPTFISTVKPATCGNNNGEVSASAVTGGTSPYQYSLNGAAFQASATFSGLAPGSYTVRVRDANGCLSSQTKEVEAIAAPSNFTVSNTPSTCGAANGQLSVGAVTGGTAPYTYSRDGTSFQASSVFAGLAAGSYTITVKDANGCTLAKAYTVQNIAGPSAVAASAEPASCADNDGRLTAGAVTGGTSPYTYSINGTSFQAGAVFTGLASGAYTLRVRDANGCLVSTSLAVGKVQPNGFTSSTTPSTCGQGNGELTVTAVTGGAAPFTYSKDGTTFQASATFASIAAGPYTITVKDAKGCMFARQVEVGNTSGPSGLTTSVKATTCGESNGEITVQAVSGGTAPYTYSLGGDTYQTGNSFSSLAAGNYELFVRDANGCLYSKEVQVQQSSGPTFTAAVKPATCGNNNGEVSASAVSGGTSPYAFSLDGAAFQASATFGNLAPGTYRLTVEDANGCNATEVKVVEAIAGPSDFTLSNTSSTCGAANGQLSVGAVTGGTAPYTYSRDGTSFQASSVFAGLAAGAYTLTVKDANGCTLAKSYTVQNIAGPSAVAASAEPASCADNDGRLTAGAVTGGTSPYTYSINGTSFQTETVFSGLVSGTYTLRVRDANGCLVSTSLAVGKVQPTGFTSSTTPSTCGQGNGQLTVTAVTGGAAPFTYSKDGTTFLSSATFASMAAGTYTINVKDAKGCIFARQVQVGNINGPSGLTASVKATTCSESNGQITVQAVSGGTAPYTYSLGGTTYQSSSSFTSLAAGEYDLFGRDANGCVFSEDVRLENVAGPTFTAAVKPATCGNNNGEVSASAVTGGTSPYHYSLDGIAFQASATFSGLAPGSYTVRVRDANGCLSSKTKEVEAIAGPSNFTVSNTPSTCGAANGQLSVGAVTGGTTPYTYSRDGINFQTSATFAGLAAGAFTLTVKDANGCTLAKAYTVQNIAGPSAVAAFAEPASCADNDGRLMASAVTGGTSPYTYSINGTSFQTETVFTGLASGAYTLRVRDANGCLVSTSLAVGKVQPNGFTSSTVSSVCGRSTGELTITSVIGGEAPFTYSMNGSSFQTASTFTNLAAGSYAITVKDTKGCTFTGQVQVSDQGGPTGFTAAVKASTCGDSNGGIMVEAVSGGTGPYAYSLDGDTFQLSTTFPALAAGEYELYVKDANGCLYVEEVRLGDISGPAFTATVKPATCGGNNGELSANVVTGGTAPYQYSIDGINFQTSATFGNLAPGSYTIKVRDAKGCLSSEAKEVEGIPGPSAFEANSASSTCGAANGQIVVETVTGGKAPFSYSNDGKNFQTSATFAGLSAGTYTITVKDATGCTLARSFTVQNIAGPSAVAASAEPASCADNDGRLTAGAVTGGTSPYTYSINGTSFQTESVFSGLASGTYTLRVRDANGCLVSTSLAVGKVQPTGFASTTRSSTCGQSNGELTVTAVTGGTAPYAYSRNGTSFQASAMFTDLPAGPYTITVKDARGCTFARQVQVNNFAGPSDLTAAVKASTCGDSNGVITVQAVSGGTAPYTYSMGGTTYQSSSSFTSLAAGEYELFVKDANGCVFSEDVRLENVAGPTFTAAVKPATCGNNNGEVSASAVTGGTSPYAFSLDGATFQASATFGNLAPGSYTLTIEDANGCKATEVKVVEAIAGPSDFEAATIASTCGAANGQLSFGTVTGGTDPYTYSKDGKNFQTSATFAGLSAGAYTLIVKDANGCTLAKAYTVQNIAGPSAVAASAEPATCADNDGRLTAGAVTGGISPYTYSINGTSFQTGAVFSGLASGTYTLRVRDANGCLVSTSLAVGKVQPTGFASTTRSSTCGQSNGELTVTAVTGGAAPFTYSKDGTTFQSSATFADLSAGPYTITVKDAKGCTFARQVQVNNLAGPSGLTAAIKSSTCGNSNGEFTVSAVSGGTAPYTYSLGGDTYQTGNSFSSLAAGDYELFVRDANGCVYTEEMRLENVAGPTFTAAVKPATCGDNNGEVSASAITGGTAPFQFSIDGTAFKSSATFGNLAPGSYILWIKDANGCLAFESGVVSAIAGPSDFESSTVSSTCGSANGQITVPVASGGTSPYSFSLNGGAFQTSATFATVRAGEHRVTVRDANGCTLTRIVTLQDISGPASFTASTTSSTCGGSDGELAVGDVQGGTDPFAFSLDGGPFQSSATFANLTSRTYTVTVKDANGCTLSQSVTLNGVGGATAISSSTTPSSCQKDDGTITVDSVTGGTGPYKYALDGITFVSSDTFTSLASADYTVYVEDANRCRSSFPVTVGTKRIQAAYVAVTPAACGQGNGTLSVASVTGGTAPYAYSLDNLIFQSSGLFQNLNPASYHLTIKDAEGCTFTLTTLVPNAEGPQSFTVDATDACCGIDNGRLLISQVIGGQSPYTFSLGASLFQANPEFKGLAIGTYQVTVRDAQGCSTSKTVVIGIGEPQAELVLTVTVTDADCIQGTGQVKVENVTGGTKPYSYSLDGLNFSPNPEINGVAPGSYLLTVKDANGITKTAQVRVEGKQAKLAYVQPVSCAGGSDGRIAVTTTGKKEKVTYSINGGVTFQDDSVFTNLSKGVYTVIARFSPNCSLSVGPVEVKEPEEIQALVTRLTKASASGSLGSAEVKVAKGGKRPFSYQLDNGPFKADSVFRNLSVGTHVVVVKDKDGCTSTLSFTIEEAPAEIEIPNGFTPNGDGINDRWVLKNLMLLYPDCKVTVFNRWGSQVFYSVGYSREWDGTHNGQTLPDGTYYCIIELGNAEPPIKKSLTIMR